MSRFRPGEENISFQKRGFVFETCARLYFFVFVERFLRNGEQMKSLDLFVGVKAEQSLRDLVRNASEAEEGEDVGVELYPVGKKDWIAGGRISSETPFGELAQAQSDMLRRLIAMGSHQRIRRDSMRFYSVHPPVPVFREPPEEREKDDLASVLDAGSETGSAICPNCGAEVHRFNLLFGPREKVVGCYLCRGEQR